MVYKSWGRYPSFCGGNLWREFLWAGRREGNGRERGGAEKFKILLCPKGPKVKKISSTEKFNFLLWVPKMPKKWKRKVKKENCIINRKFKSLLCPKLWMWKNLNLIELFYCWTLTVALQIPIKISHFSQFFNWIVGP